MVEREESPTLYQKRFFLPAVVRMTVFCNFFPAAKKLPRKVARWLSDIPASRFAHRRGLRNSLRSNSPRPISVFSLAPGSPIKAGIFPLRHYRLSRVRVVSLCHSESRPMVECEESRILFEILPPCGRQNDIVFEVDYPMSFRAYAKNLMLLPLWIGILHFTMFRSR